MLVQLGGHKRSVVAGGWRVGMRELEDFREA